MNTPICDFVEEYRKKQTSRFHMPGHKGNSALNSLNSRDITEIEGADDLYHADGIILQSEENASALFGSRHTFYSTEGSSLCIRAMLYLAANLAPQSLQSSHAPRSYRLPQSPHAPHSYRMPPSHHAPHPRRKILAARNAHKTFLYACALLDFDVIWLYPEETQTDSLCSCLVSPESLQQTLEACCVLPEEERPFAVFLTSPDYLGKTQDIAALSAVCHRYHLPLLVDNAHGAYLKFLFPSRHPLDLGADMCCDSAHKTLPALTGCAYLHVSQTALYPYEKHARTALSLFGSTSPSYLLLQSLDQCNAYLAEPVFPQSTHSYKKRLAQCITKKEAVCQTLRRHGFLLKEADPLRIVVHAAALGFRGQDLADYFRLRQIECEYADRDYVVLMATPENSVRDWERLERLQLSEFLETYPASANTADITGTTDSTNTTDTTCTRPDILPAMPANSPALTIREAMFSPSETVPIERALGRICAAPVVSCPPAIPVVVSGERITEESILLCRYYEIPSLQVVAEEA